MNLDLALDLYAGKHLIPMLAGFAGGGKRWSLSAPSFIKTSRTRIAGEDELNEIFHRQVRLELSSPPNSLCSSP